ncbi:hypothetical protein LCGC14_1469560, partial [marine sediment metagenome]
MSERSVTRPCSTWKMVHIRSDISSIHSANAVPVHVRLHFRALGPLSRRGTCQIHYVGGPGPPLWQANHYI